MIRKLSRFINKFKVVSVNTYCPVCNVKNAGFNALPDYYKTNAEKYGYIHFGKGEMTALETYSCNNCGASDRERLYAYWLSNRLTGSYRKQVSKILHFAPENSLAKFIIGSNIFEQYETADLLMDSADHKVDLMNLPFSDNTYDFFICSHVLEHVDNDLVAISELFRVTKKGGQGILMVPIVVGLPETIENPEIKDEGERWRLFGQNDHVRLYSHNDYVSRVKSCGFKLELLDESYFGQKVFRKLGLKSTSILYIVTKP